MQAVVLAAGKGVRLKPLTDNMPKAMVKVAGKPALQRILEGLSQAGFTEVHLVVGYKKEAIEEAFKENFRGMKLNYFVQEKQLGTGHALSLVEDFVDENFLVTNADVLVDTELYKELAKKDEFDQSDAKIVSVFATDTWRFGCLKTEKGIIKDIVEKPTPGQEPSHFVNLGVYRFDKLIFQALRQIKMSTRNEFELVDAIKELINAGGLVVELKYSGAFSNLGDKQDLEEAEKKFVLGS